jgi:hypothetical protein
MCGWLASLGRGQPSAGSPETTSTAALPLVRKHELLTQTIRCSSVTVGSIENQKRAVRPFVPRSEHTLEIVAYDLAELERITRKLADDHSSLKSQGIDLIAWGPDARSNTVVVRIADYTVEHAQALQDGYGGPCWVTVKPWIGGLPRRC